MWLIVFMIIIIAAVIVCFSLAAAAKNAEMISQLWLEKQREKPQQAETELKRMQKTGNFMHEQNKRRIENVKIKVYF